jgi:hypothetical protein
VITVDDSHAQELISKAEQEFDACSFGIEPGSFARVVTGEPRDLCGSKPVFYYGPQVEASNETATVDSQGLPLSDEAG